MILKLEKYQWFVSLEEGSEVVFCNEGTFEKFKQWWLENKDYKFINAIRRN